MPLLRRFPILLAAIACSGCFQFATLIRVNADGSGTIEQRLLFTREALAQLTQLAVMGGREGANPLSDEAARAGAARLGPGVTLLSSTPIADDTGEGRASIYAFTDVSQLRITPEPGVPEGPMRDLGAGAEAITMQLTRQPNGDRLLTIALPQPSWLGSPLSPSSAPATPPAEQFAMVKQMFRGARVAVAVEPAGVLVRTNSAHVDGPRVTLTEVDLDRLLADETLPARLQAAGSADEMSAILKSIPGVKINVAREITIEFTPAQ